jgi:hypothetical protein
MRLYYLTSLIVIYGLKIRMDHKLPYDPFLLYQFNWFKYQLLRRKPLQ